MLVAAICWLSPGLAGLRFVVVRWEEVVIGVLGWEIACQVMVGPPGGQGKSLYPGCGAVGLRSDSGCAALVRAARCLG